MSLELVLAPEQVAAVETASRLLMLGVSFAFWYTVRYTLLVKFKIFTGKLSRPWQASITLIMIGDWVSIVNKTLGSVALLNTSHAIHAAGIALLIMTLFKLKNRSNKPSHA